MLKLVISCFVLFFAKKSVESLQGTVCKYYDDVTDASSCSEQTIVVENKQEVISKSSISQIVNETVERKFYKLQQKVNTLTISLENITRQNSLKESNNPCHPNPCRNRGVCIKNNGDYLCKCFNGYQGANCSGSCTDGIIYENQCIKIPSCSSVTFAKAQETCSNMNSTLVEITSVAMYNTVYGLLLSRLQGDGVCSGSSKIDVWLGSTFESINNPNNEITLRNGTKVQLGNWHHGYPYGDSTWVNLGIQVHSDVGSIYNGFFNRPPTYTFIPLCSYKI